MTEPETISEAQAAPAVAAAEAERRHKARQPFPLAGEGCFFYFPLGSLVAVEKFVDQVEPDWFKKHDSPFAVMERLLLAGQAAAVRAAIDCGLKREVDGKVEPVTSIDLDAVDWPVAEIVTPAMNALCFAHTGQTYHELIAEVTAAAEARASEARNAWQENRAK